MAAIRKFEYIISTNSISPSDIKKGGVQGEHKATQIDFVASDDLIAELKSLAANGGTLCYRFDSYDGTKTKYSYGPVEFGIEEDKRKFSHLIRKEVTRFGGMIEVRLIITLTNDEVTEREYKTYSVKLSLNSLPDSADVSGEGYDSVSTLAMIARSNAGQAERCKEAALAAAERTEAARLALENGAEWEFDGGDAGTEADIEYILDDTVSQGSNNPVKSSGIYAYCKQMFEEVKKAAILAAHPVGSYFWTNRAKDKGGNPAELFGGIWIRVKDRFILARGDKSPVDSSDTVNYTGGKALTDGAVKVTLETDNLPSHHHRIATALNADESTNTNVITSDASSGGSYVKDGKYIHTSTCYNTTTGNQCGNTAIDVTPPYILAYCWRRLSDDYDITNASEDIVYVSNAEEVSK